MHTTSEYDTFTCTCRICGATVSVVDGREQPHRCRIEIPERSES